jgi:F0F1-type ATP synthase assembly protein I
MKRTKHEKLERSLAFRLGRISGYSMVLVIMTFLGLYAGMKLDGYTGMSPNFTFIGLIIGIVLGFRGFIHEVMVERRTKNT